MQVGFIGLGNMGLPMATRLVKAGFAVHGYDVSESARKRFEQNGGISVSELSSLFRGTTDPQRIVILMLPDTAIAEILDSPDLPLIAYPDTVIIEGGNTHPEVSRERAARFRGTLVEYLDVGFAGRVHGAEHGLCVMAGGNLRAYKTAQPVLEALAVPGGCALVGSHGSGHFLKSFHNGLEYVMIELFAELIEGLKKVGPQFGLTDFESAYFLLQRGSIIEAAVAPKVWNGCTSYDYQDLSPVAGGGRFGAWLNSFALNAEVALPLLAMAVQLRFMSRSHTTIQQTVAAARREIGNHPVVLTS